MAAKKLPSESGWTYGVSKNPSNWHQTADALSKMKKKGPSLGDILQQIADNGKGGQRGNPPNRSN